MCANFEYSNTYFEDRIQMQICNNYTSRGVIIGKHVIRGFILKKTNMNLQKLIFHVFCVSFQAIAFILNQKYAHTHAHTHTNFFLRKNVIQFFQIK